MATFLGKKTPPFFTCLNCDFSCSNKKDFNRHTLTSKHQIATNSNQKTPKNPTAKYVCVCDKSYNDRSGFWRHKKKCIKYKEQQEEEEIDKDTELVWFLVKQNKEFKEMMLEQQNYMLELAKNSNSTVIYNNKKFLKIKEWVEEYPTCMAHDDKKNDDYLNILGQITSSFTHLHP